MDDNDLINSLSRSYGYQSRLYGELVLIVQKILGKVTLARGDMSGVKGLFEEKYTLLNKIGKEREAIAEEVELWNERKSKIRENSNFEKLDKVLGNIEQVISKFMNIEDQLFLFMEPQENESKS